MADQTVTPRPRRLLVFLPVIIFLALAGLFLIQLTSGRNIAGRSVRTPNSRCRTSAGRGAWIST